MPPGGGGMGPGQAGPANRTGEAPLPSPKPVVDPEATTSSPPGPLVPPGPPSASQLRAQVVNMSSTQMSGYTWRWRRASGEPDYTLELERSEEPREWCASSGALLLRNPSGAEPALITRISMAGGEAVVRCPVAGGATLTVAAGIRVKCKWGWNTKLCPAGPLELVGNSAVSLASGESLDLEDGTPGSSSSKAPTPPPSALGTGSDAAMGAPASVGLTANTSAEEAKEALLSALKADVPAAQGRGSSMVAGAPVLAAGVNNETLARCVAVVVRVDGNEVNRWDRVCSSSSVSVGEYIPPTCLEPWIYPKWKSAPAKGDASKLNRFGTLQIDVRNCQSQNQLKQADNDDSSNSGATGVASSPALLAAGMNEVAGPAAASEPGGGLGRRLLLRD